MTATIGSIIFWTLLTVASLLVAAWFTWRAGHSARPRIAMPSERQVRAAMLARQPISDQDLRDHHFSDPVAGNAAVLVRACLTKYIDVPPDRVHPDDDLTALLDELDPIDLVDDIARSLRIGISLELGERMLPNLRSIVEVALTSRDPARSDCLNCRHPITQGQQRCPECGAQVPDHHGAA
jgi:hypothetical protein